MTFCTESPFAHPRHRYRLNKQVSDSEVGEVWWSVRDQCEPIPGFHHRASPPMLDVISGAMEALDVRR